MTRHILLLAALLCSACLPASAHEAGIHAEPSDTVPAAMDIIETSIGIDGDMAVFSTRVRGSAGAEKPAATGNFAGAGVYAYVWPTSLNSSDVGFDADQGIVALAVTFHPDFDDAANGGANRDVWHPHWVVLAEDAACNGGLKVVDIAEGTTPKVPATWPKVPLLIDSPDYATDLSGDTVNVTLPIALVGGLVDAAYDGVTAGLRINADLHAPLLCVDNVFKVASGDLSLPGKVSTAQ
ncbi:hypothetical protein [Devosia aquimaris]|uniref:hypothetical protein n=1 Tax=Devosia aquimaris TaxID=2866214 RepID=UPI001CD0DB80|nr:hypothetical protein [Devosia sp. CJK-A8-3]